MTRPIYILADLRVRCSERGWTRRAAAASAACELLDNLDDMTLEVYRGSQHSPHHHGRYASLPPCGVYGGVVIYPCALIATFPLTDIPSNFAQRITR